MNRLDYIGVALLGPEQQPLLQQFAEGDITMQELIAAAAQLLEESNQGVEP